MDTQTDQDELFRKDSGFPYGKPSTLIRRAGCFLMCEISSSEFILEVHLVHVYEQPCFRSTDRNRLLAFGKKTSVKT